MNKLVLKAGIPAIFGSTGRYFRIFAADTEVNVEFYGSYDGGEWSLHTPLKSGIGLNFNNRPAPFTQITITSAVDQTVEYWSSIDGADDDRLAASATIVVSTAGKTAAVPVKQTLTDLVNGHQVLATNPTRRTATYSISGNCFVLDKANGIKLSAGLYSWDNQAALILVPESSGVEFRVLEEGE